jgi:outer membrane lipoprotein SlyB
MFKKYITTFLMSTMLAVMFPVMATTTFAGTTLVSTHCYNARTRTYVQCKRPNIYRRHRRAFNIGIGTGLGMLVGGMLGGKKGLVIGGLAGAGGGALVTHKQRPKNYTRYYRRY